MVDMTGNIYTSPEDYRIAPNLEVSPQDYHRKMKNGVRIAPVDWQVFSIPLGIRLAICGSEEEAKAFIQSRCNPEELPARVYSDICRCGKGGPAWDYIKTGSLIFERCSVCSMPMRNDVLLALNAPHLKNFDLDDFLNM